MTSTGTNGGVDDELVRSALVSIRAAAGTAGLTRNALEQILTENALPARYYGLVMAKIDDAGIRIDDAQIAEPAEETYQGDSGGWNQVGFDHFLKRNWHGVLTAEEEHDLGVKVQRGRLAREALESGAVPPAAVKELRRRAVKGDRSADDLVRANLRLVSKLASKFHGRTGPALEIEDLFQEGVIGLSHAISKFDPERGFKLSTYATWWIRQSMERAVANQERAIRLPVHMWERKRMVWRAERELRGQGRAYGAKEIAADVGLPVETVRELKAVGQRLRSLDRRIGEGGMTEGDLIRDSNGIDPADVVERLGCQEEALQRLATLPEREREIMVLRFGIGGGGARTLEEIGTVFGVTRERIRQIEVKSLELLRVRTVTGSDRSLVHANSVLIEDTIANISAKAQRLSSDERYAVDEVNCKADSPAKRRRQVPAEPRADVPEVIGEASEERLQRWVSVAELFPDGLIG